MPASAGGGHRLTGRPRGRIGRDGLLVIMALTSGAVDATSFLRAGHVFSSVITGNLVLLGVSAAQADGALALSAGGALAAYAIGVAMAAPLVHRPGDAGSLWPAGVTRALALELVLLAGLAAAWQIGGPMPSGAARFAVLGLGAAAMGMQSESVRALGSFSTTYLTSTLTALLSGIVRLEPPDGFGRSIGIILAAVAGAAGAAGLLRVAPAWIPALELMPLVLATAGARRLHGRRSTVVA